MRRIGVVIGRTSNGMFWETLGQFLDNVSDIVLEHVDGEGALKEALRSHKPQVLILEKCHNGQEVQDYQCYFDLRPGLGIIVIDPAGIDTIIHLRNTGCEQLVDLIRSLSTEEASSVSDSSSRLQYLSAAGETSSAKPWGLKLLTNSAYLSSREHLNDLCEWLDLSLHLYFVREATGNAEKNTPGWAMSADRARALLGDEYACAAEDELSESRKRIETKIATREGMSHKNGSRSRFVALAKVFDLRGIDKKIILLTLAPELDDRYARIFGYLNDDLTQRRPTLSTMKQLLLGDKQLAWDINQMLTHDGPLAKYQMVFFESDNPMPVSVVGLKLAPEILAYLLAESGQTPNYGAQLELVEANQSSGTVISKDTSPLKDRLSRWRVMMNGDDKVPIIQLVGSDTTLRWFVREVVNVGDSIVIFRLNVGDPATNSLFDQIDSAARVAVLQDAILVVSGLEQLQKGAQQPLAMSLISRLATRAQRLVIHCDTACMIPGIHEIWQVRRELPDFNARAKEWTDRARLVGIELSKSDASSLAATVRFDEPEIDATLSLCRGELNQASLISSIQTAARQVARAMVPSLARRLKTVFEWKDIVLPVPTLTLLQQIPGHVRHAGEVFEGWGYSSRFPFGCGVAALFSGPSGTGKTMAAQIIASELNVELFQIDLANTVSKYIGETEKNLDIIFNAAEQASAVLLFDEADALFGKRTEVKDAHDRYANVEVAYLLQRMEAYSGLAILTTNFKQNLDSAFLRRLRFVIEFPAPSAKHREAIWRCVFPPKVQFANDVDTTFLARRLDLTGGHIQQIAVRAAFAAVAEGGPIAMKHILQATREELIKLGMLGAERTLSDCAPKLVGGEAS